jgi:Nif-specific regulatory protein
MNKVTTKNTAQKSEILFELAAILGQQIDFEEILRLISTKACHLFDAEAASITMINPRTQNTVKTIVKEGSQTNQKCYQFVQANVIGWVSKKKEAFLSPDVQKDSRFRKEVFGDNPVKSVMCVPLHNEGLTIGYVLALNKNGNSRFLEDDLQLFEKMAALTAPFLNNAQRIQEYFNTPLPEIALISKYESGGLLGKSRQFIDLLRAIEAAARCDVRVLLEGQSGTGKELIARAIHTFSNRCEKPFIAIDCGAIPGHLIESELFGHIKGAFTGATHDRKGLFQQANQGTLFLDEITNLPMDIQSKLLRFLQEGEIRPVGSDNVHDIDVRIVAAASISLLKMVEEKKFREDLYFRLHVYPINVPSLNERAEDIPVIANSFLTKFNDAQNKSIKYFHGQIMDFMCNRIWKGNIRELINFIERLVTLAPPESTIIELDILPRDMREEFNRFNREQKNIVARSLKDQLFESEKKIIQNALIAHNWNQTKAAKSLDLTEALIRYRMKKLGIKRHKAG